MTFKQKILIAMYESVERMNQHYKKGRSAGIKAEQLLQEHLRKNFVYVKDYKGSHD